jgi:hypothetical protein
MKTCAGARGSGVSMAAALGHTPSGQRLSATHKCVPQKLQKQRSPSLISVGLPGLRMRA